jgi:hypothetical protein
VTLANGVVTYSSPSTPRSFGSTASFSCSAGYYLSGSASATCSGSGSWNWATQPSCVGEAPIDVCGIGLIHAHRSVRQRRRVVQLRVGLPDQRLGLHGLWHLGHADLRWYVALDGVVASSLSSVCSDHLQRRDAGQRRRDLLEHVDPAQLRQHGVVQLLCRLLPERLRQRHVQRLGLVELGYAAVMCR